MSGITAKQQVILASDEKKAFPQTCFENNVARPFHKEIWLRKIKAPTQANAANHIADISQRRRAALALWEANEIGMQITEADLNTAEEVFEETGLDTLGEIRGPSSQSTKESLRARFFNSSTILNVQVPPTKSATS